MKLDITIPENREAGLKFAAWQSNQETGENKTPEEYLAGIIAGALDSYETSRSAYVNADRLAKYEVSTPEIQAEIKAALAVSEPWL